VTDALTAATASPGPAGAAPTAPGGERLACVYVLTLEEPYLTRARVSLASVRRHDPGLDVTLVVPSADARARSPGETALLALADRVLLVPPAHAGSRYFQDNRRHLADVDADRILYLDVDTIAFASLRDLAGRFAGYDVAARASPWIWRHGYERRLAPDLVAPLNGGVLCLSRSFCETWATRAPARHAALADDPRRGELVRWLRSLSPTAYHRDEFVLSEEAWSGRWSVGLMTQRDCYLLDRWPAQEDPSEWLRSTILHTYSQTWEACVERLREVTDLPYAGAARGGRRPAAGALGAELGERGTGVSQGQSATAVADPAARFDQRWLDWLVAQLLARQRQDVLVDVLVRRGFPQAFAESKVAELASSPILLAAARAHRPKAKAASMLALLGELFARSGFALEKRRLEAHEFYRDYFFANRPVVLTGLMDDWPARTAWRPERLRARFADVVVEITDGREGDTRYEGNFLAHRRSVTFAEYVDMVVTGGPTNDYYLVARNHVLERTELRALKDDFSCPAGFLDPDPPVVPYVRLWFGPAGTLTPLHCDDRNILFGQVHGRKQVRLIAPQFLGSLANDVACYSSIDLEAVDLERYPAMANVPVLETELEPGEFLFIPLGWWHWVKSLDVSISLTFTNFFHNEPELVWRQATA